ncbi:MAG TPA: heme d1 biosynthesis radical SAM protein NirJ [Pseudolabrys sp.]|jgi:heme d1 biosynthesis radical SAM protein NirJ|nr:heme d1 biosynthesis radical SAM protein NirJ [Pseudolabrys sp.]
MFRLTHYLREIIEPTPFAPVRAPSGPVVIWNLIRRCNLTCKHCYSISGDVDFPGELSTAEIIRVMEELKAFRVPVLILSGGEPLMRSDIFEISAAAKAMRFYVGLSTNGTLIDATLADRIHDTGYDYVGISLDGIGAAHDRFRRKQGAYDAALGSLRLLRDRGVKVGVRFTMTNDNAAELPAMLDLVEGENFPKFYLSHLVYAGRGNKNRGGDASWQATRDAMDMVIERAWRWAREGREMEVVTGNNDADAVYLLHWAKREAPHAVPFLRAKLAQWGGNSSGVNIANIDNLGNVHPDTMWWHYNLGNVKERPFSAIWTDLSDPIMAGLKRRPRAIGGRCAVCAYFDICGGNTRVRAMRITGDPWAEDPGCYLADDEIGLDAPNPRVTTTPYRGARYEVPPLVG